MQGHKELPQYEILF